VVEARKAKSRNKSRIRAPVKHLFGVIKRPSGFGKVRDRGLQKDATRAFAVLALANNLSQPIKADGTGASTRTQYEVKGPKNRSKWSPNGTFNDLFKLNRAVITPSGRFNSTYLAQP